MSNNELKTASVLAFERKLDPSDALFYAGKWENRSNFQDWRPVEIHEKAIRGTISNRLKAKDTDPAKLDASIEKPNLQKVDVATLPQNCDTLKVTFTLRVLGGTGSPSACNNAAYKSRLKEVVESYVNIHHFKELAQRYAYNLANGRFLWRNRVGVAAVEVNIRERSDKENRSWQFNALELSLRDFTCNEKHKPEIDRLAEVIAIGLSGKKYILLEVSAFVRIGEGQEVFPSQELILDKAANGKSKTLYSVGGIAAMHSQKIGNAIRTVDTWYPDAAELGPIPVEPYGSVTSQGKAYRQPRQKIDFYNLLDRWLLKNEVPDVGNQHYVMANLVRGGVFGESEKE